MVSIGGVCRSVFFFVIISSSFLWCRCWDLIGHARVVHSFLLRDWDGAQTNYRAAASDFKNDKAHEPYAAAQEMLAVSMLLEAILSNDREKARGALSTVCAHLSNAIAGYERANARPYALRVAMLLQLALRESANHSAAGWLFFFVVFSFFLFKESDHFYSTKPINSLTTSLFF